MHVNELAFHCDGPVKNFDTNAIELGSASIGHRNFKGPSLPFARTKTGLRRPEVPEFWRWCRRIERCRQVLGPFTRGAAGHAFGVDPDSDRVAPKRRASPPGLRSGVAAWVVEFVTAGAA